MYLPLGWSRPVRSWVYIDVRNLSSTLLNQSFRLTVLCRLHNARHNTRTVGECNRVTRQTRAKLFPFIPNAYCLLVYKYLLVIMTNACIRFGPADYPVLQCLGQTCTGATYVQEVLYILHLSCVMLDYIPVM